jgi:F0F1-type ATP synthase membrane subunit a
MGAVLSMSKKYTHEQIEAIKAKKSKEEKESEAARVRDWKMEIYKMVTSLVINVFVITIIALCALNTTADLSTRFMSLLEIVIGAIFGVTATQIAK